jgi:hypothetical protein
MGAWDTGVFDNDKAADFLYDFLRTQISRIESHFVEEKLNKDYFLEVYGIPEILPLMAIVVTLCEEYSTAPLLEQAQVEAWEKKYLEIFDKNTIWAKNVEAERRKVIIETFQKFKNQVTGLGNDIE